MPGHGEEQDRALPFSCLLTTRKQTAGLCFRTASACKHERHLSRCVIFACNGHLYSKHCSESLREKMLTLLRFSASEPSTKSATTTCPLTLSSSKTRPIGRGRVTFKISLSIMRLQIRLSCRPVHQVEYSMAVPNQSCKQSTAAWQPACKKTCVHAQDCAACKVLQMSELILCISGAKRWNITQTCTGECSAAFVHASSTSSKTVNSFVESMCFWFNS